jgi:hypothetical protein
MGSGVPERAVGALWDEPLDFDSDLHVTASFPMQELSPDNIE